MEHPDNKIELSLKKNFRRRGFSVIELLVVVIIIASIGIILVVNINSGIRSDVLRIARSQIIQDLRKMQSNALSGKVCVTADASVCSAGGDFDYDYGMRLDQCVAENCTYKLFIDKTSPDLNQFDSASPSELLTDGQKNVYNPQIQVYLYVKSGSDYVSKSNLHILYEPYTSEVKFKVQNDSTNYQRVKVELRYRTKISYFIIDQRSGVIIEPEPGATATPW